MKLTIDEIFKMIRHEKRMEPKKELEIYRKWVPILEREFENFCFAIRPPNQVNRPDLMPCTLYGKKESWVCKECASKQP